MIEIQEHVPPHEGQQIYVVQLVKDTDVPSIECAVVRAVEGSHLLIELEGQKDRWGDPLRRWVSRACWVSSPVTKLIPRTPETAFLSGSTVAQELRSTAHELDAALRISLEQAAATHRARYGL